jgi:hypothetical protein
MKKRSEALTNMVVGLEQGLTKRTDELAGAGKLKEALAAIEELKFKLTLAETVLTFYGELPTAKAMMVDTVLPPELKAMLKKGATT